MPWLWSLSTAVAAAGFGAGSGAASGAGAGAGAAAASVVVVLLLLLVDCLTAGRQLPLRGSLLRCCCGEFRNAVPTRKQSISGRCRYHLVGIVGPKYGPLCFRRIPETLQGYVGGYPGLDTWIYGPQDLWPIPRVSSSELRLSFLDPLLAAYRVRATLAPEVWILLQPLIVSGSSL